MAYPSRRSMAMKLYNRNGPTSRYSTMGGKKGALVWHDETFDDSVEDLSEVKDGSRYYGGFVFVSRTSGHLCNTACLNPKEAGRGLAGAV